MWTAHRTSCTGALLVTTRPVSPCAVATLTLLVVFDRCCFGGKPCWAELGGVGRPVSEETPRDSSFSGLSKKRNGGASQHRARLTAPARRPGPLMGARAAPLAPVRGWTGQSDSKESVVMPRVPN